MLRNVKRLLKRENWNTFLFRGNRAFLAFGGVYLQSRTETETAQERIWQTVPEAPKGSMFVRFGSAANRKSKTALLIAGVGRFGNSVAQVMNSVLLAKLLNSGDILFHRFDAIGNRAIDLDEGLRLSPLRFRKQKGMVAPSAIWRTYAITPEILFSDPWDQAMRGTRLSLQRALGLDSISEEWADPETLTIYVRGGDVFDPNPEEYYGQPPWVFYQRVLEHRGWGFVHIVSEDTRNPVVGQILEWCRSKGVGVRFLGEQFCEAVDVLRSARNLVNARGTFLPAILCLAGSSRTVYHFGRDVPRFLAGEGLEVFVVEDTTGVFTLEMLSANWHNSAEQQRLMLTYPLNAVSEPSRAH